MKKIISHNITTLHFSGTIDEVIERLKEQVGYYSEKYSNLRIDYDYCYEGGDSYYRHDLIGDILETDYEENLRMTQEKENTERQEKYQREQYEVLKAKFETK